MKKVIFVFAAFVAMSIASCGNSTNGTTENDSTMVDSLEVVDTLQADSVE